MFRRCPCPRFGELTCRLSQTFASRYAELRPISMP